MSLARQILESMNEAGERWRRQAEPSPEQGPSADWAQWLRGLASYLDKKAPGAFVFSEPYNEKFRQRDVVSIRYKVKVPLNVLLKHGIDFDGGYTGTSFLTTYKKKNPVKGFIVRRHMGAKGDIITLQGAKSATGGRSSYRTTY